MKYVYLCDHRAGCNVAPLAGAWIEISAVVVYYPQNMSPPSRGRGLK